MPRLRDVVQCRPGQCGTNTSLSTLSSRAHGIQSCNPSAKKHLATRHRFIIQIAHKKLHRTLVLKQQWGSTPVEPNYGRVGRFPVRRRYAGDVRSFLSARPAPNPKVSLALEFRGEIP